jgi:hypothetical protein
VLFPVARGSDWELGADGGYTVIVPGGENHHEVGMGPMLAWVPFPLSLSWIPRFEVDPTIGGSACLGVRNTISASWLDIFVADVSHEWVGECTSARNDFRVGIGLDLGVVFYRAAKGEGVDRR